MKKTLLSLAFATIGLAAFAQKPAAGDMTAEAVLLFQTGTAPISFNLNSQLPGVPELRFRYFLSESMAARVRLGFGMSSTDSKLSDGGTTPVIAETKTTNGFSLMLAPGIEKHFAGTTKLSPYVGVELPIGLGGSTTIEVTNAHQVPVSPGDVKKDDTYKSVSGSTFLIGLNAVMGVDYYIGEGLYVGGEMGLGIFQSASVGDGTVDSKTSGVAAPQQKMLGSSSFNLFGVYTTGGIRLGYKF